MRESGPGEDPLQFEDGNSDPGRVGEQGTSVDERQPGPVHEPRLPLPEGQFYPGNSRGGLRQSPVPEDARPLDERV